MNISPLVEHLRSSLPGSNLAFVVSALRQDPVVWESLQDPDLWQSITAQSRLFPEDWSPASLGLLALQLEEAEALQPAALRADIQFPLESGLRRRAARAFESMTTGQGILAQDCDEMKVDLDNSRLDSPGSRLNSPGSRLGLPKSNCHAPAVLAQSVLLALALRERRRLTGSWNKLEEELTRVAQAQSQVALAQSQVAQAQVLQVQSQASSNKPGRSTSGSDGSISIADDEFFSTWCTPLACLYGLVPDAFEMLRSLLTPGVGASHHALVVHILLSNPLPPEKAHNQLRALLSALPLAEDIILLNQLSLKRPDMIRALAEELLSLSRDPGLNTDDPQPALPAQADYSVYINRLNQLLLLARVNQLAIKPVQAQPFLNAALEASNRLQAELAALIAQNAAQRGDNPAVLPALKQAAQFAPDNPIYQANLALAQFANGPIENAQPVSAGEQETLSNQSYPTATTSVNSLSPALLLAEIHIAAKKGEQEKARSYAQAFLDQLKETTSPTERTPAARYLMSRHGLFDQTGLPGKTFIPLLLDLDLPAGAAACAALVLQVQPDDPELLALLAKAQAATGMLTDAVGSLEVALCLSPRTSSLHRQLAGYYESLQDWQSALKEYNCLMDKSSGELPTPDDLHRLAACALKVDAPEAVEESCAYAISACQRALEMNAEDGLAHSDLGRALLVQGDLARAEEHLNLATQFAPALVEPWLGLAHLQKDAGRTQQALETLRAGSQAAVENPELYLELGEAYLADWEGRGHPAPTQALSMFQRAHVLATNGTDKSEQTFTPLLMQISLRLGETLNQLGHADEAFRVLEPAYQFDPVYPELAYNYAQVLLALGEPEKALPALKRVMDAGNGDLPTYLDYGRALLSIHAQPEEATRALRQVLEWDPGHAEAMALLAEALDVCGEHEAALEFVSSRHGNQPGRRPDLVLAFIPGAG